MALTGDDIEMIEAMIDRAVQGAVIAVLKAVDSDGNAQATAEKDRVLNDVPRGEHYGLASHAPAGTEAVILDTQAGPVSIAERSASRPAVTVGQVALYDDDANQIWLKSTTGGADIHIGRRGAADAAARVDDTVGALGTFASWTKSVKDDIAAIKADLVTYGLAIPSTPPTLVPLTTTQFAVGATIGDITSGSAITEIE